MIWFGSFVLLILTAFVMEKLAIINWTWATYRAMNTG